MTAAVSQEVPAKLHEIIARIDGSQLISRDEQNEILNELESYECWNPSFRLLQKVIADPKRRTPDDYLRLARIYNRFLEDIQKAAQICSKMMKDIRLDFKSFSRSGLREILIEDDFAGEAKILNAVLPVMQQQEDKVACLERLCLLYEKKVFDEENLNQSYEKLLKIDPYNQKALRYFKIVFTQNNDWEEVARILKTLLEHSSHKSDKSRLALELASVFLYQLDSPSLAIDLIEKYCAGSDLDTSTVLYDACYRVGDAEGCLKVLKECLSKVETDFTRAVLYYKMGEWEDKLGRKDAAKECFRKSHSRAPKFLEPLERLIEISLESKDWGGTIQFLDKLQAAVQEYESAEKLREAKMRLKNGLEHAR